MATHPVRPDRRSTQTTPVFHVRNEDVLSELKLLIRARYGLIWLDTIEEERAESLLKHLADDMGLPYFRWTVDVGLRRIDQDQAVFGTKSAKTALLHIETAALPAIYHLQSFDFVLDGRAEEQVVRAQLASVARQFARINGALIITGNDLSLSESVKQHAAHLPLPLPDRDEHLALLQHLYRDLNARTLNPDIKIEMSSADMNRLLNNLTGLTLLEAEKILTKAMVEDGRLAPCDIQHVVQAKKKIVEREGVLEYFPVEESMADIAGMGRLKYWLAKRKAVIAEPERAAQYGLAFPKGLLLLGIPGAGKSLCAKAVAMEWGLPLLKMDPSSLYNKYMGESENNFKRAMAIAEKMAPVVLWIDEIEKAFASGGEMDGGVSQRILGTFLSWLQECQSQVFVVATCNDVVKLPPELLRKGRFDEIFFVDLPSTAARTEIFQLHLARRGHDLDQFDLPQLAALTEGFSGAEIEQAIVSALYTAFAAQGPLSMNLLSQECQQTLPLSQTRAEHLEALRAWAQDRTVPAE